MVGREWSEPVEGKVADPDNKNGEVDGENPYHENENGVTVVVKVVCKVGALVKVRIRR
jgi:hypothetical protein